MHKSLHFFTRLLFIAFILTTLMLTMGTWQSLQAASLPQDSSGVVILAYFEVSDDEDAISPVSPALFADQMRELQSLGANIMALPDVIAAWQKGETLPAKTVAITFDGAYQSVVQNAVPILRDKKWPFTMMVAPHQVGRENSRFVTWDDLQELQDDTAISYGLMPISYTSFGSQPALSYWKSLNSARSIFRENMDDQSPQLMAFPYGMPPQEFDGTDMTTKGYVAGLGLQSGAAHAGLPRWLLPRFTMTQSAGDEDRIHQIMQSIPFPVSDIQPVGGRIASNPPPVGFTVPHDLRKHIKNTMCRASDGQIAKLAMLTEERAELRFANVMPCSRVRINCTLVDGANNDGDVQYRWLGFLFELAAP